jgi:hypothetical protein
VPWLKIVPLRQARIIVQTTKTARAAIKARAGWDMRAPAGGCLTVPQQRKEIGYWSS